MKIITLEAERIRRVVAVRINLDGGKDDAVFVTGQNDQGKSSTLAAIGFALCGGRIAEDEIAKGFESGEVRITLGDAGKAELTVRKVLKRGQSPRLIVRNAAGLQGTQGTLDALVGPIGLDPVALAVLDPIAQAAAIQKALGLNFADLDALEKKTYDERTDVGRKIRDLEGELTSIPEDAGALPPAEVNPADLVAERDRILAKNDANQKTRDALDLAKDAVDQIDNKIADAQDRIRGLEEQIVEIRNFLRAQGVNREDAAKHLTATEAAVADLVDRDTAEIDAKIANVGALNERIRKRARRAALSGAIDRGKMKIEAFADELFRIGEARKARVLSKGLPAGLESIEFTPQGLTFDGFPLKALGTGKALRVTTGIACALTKGLKIILIKAGNDLDRTNLKAVVETAAAAGVQVWIERIEKPADGAAIEIVEGQGTLGDWPEETDAAPEDDQTTASQTIAPDLKAELDAVTPAPKRAPKSKEASPEDMIRAQARKEGRLL